MKKTRMKVRVETRLPDEDWWTLDREYEFEGYGGVVDPPKVTAPSIWRVVATTVECDGHVDLTVCVRETAKV